MRAIETSRLTKYYGKHRGIIDLDMEISQGEIFGFVGPNGAGKSTTIRCLVGLIFPSGGRASVLGMDIAEKPKEIRQRIGYLPSEVEYYDGMSVRELLEYSARFYGNSAGGRLNELADIFQVELNRRIFDLSSGNRKKVAILQCLLHGPELLILDEPTSGLDPLMQARFYEVIKEENRRGVTVFFSSHILSEVQKICRRVAIIKEGRIVAVEDFDSLRKKQLNRVKADFLQPIKPEQLTSSQVISLDVQGQHAEILHSGQINQFLEKLAGLPLDRLSIEEPSLEEIFLHYYGGEA